MTLRVTSVSSTYCFVDVAGRLAQVARVVVADGPQDVDATVEVHGAGLSPARAWEGQLSPLLAGVPGGPSWCPSNDPGLAGPGHYTPGPPLPEGVVVEVPVFVDEDRPAGTVLEVTVRARAGARTAEAKGSFVVREPGWRMLMVSHFHYDPVWWNTQAAYTSGWDELLWAQDRRETFQHTGLALVEAHLQRARTDPLYKFVLAEVDYLKPFWDLYPDRRQEMRELIATGRLEIVGGTYNEPNTNLTGAETAVRAAVYGLGFQRDVMGASPESAWQLDVFGHDPQFPGLMAECGLTSSAWARGPFHQWGPARHMGDTSWMQFPSEFEWVAPNGKGLLTSYMPTHYSSGWELERATSAEGAMWRAYEMFSDLAAVAAVPVTLLPVGTDYTPPSRYVTDVARRWAERYVWPRFEVGLPREFFAAVREGLARRGRLPSPQSRDMNPVYTGKDVSFIDTKQAQRLAEVRLAEAEAMAALASVLGAPVPERALDKAWRQLVFGAHHDGITGSESDQVYLDLLAGWREAFELARQVEEHSRSLLVAAVGTASLGPAATGAGAPEVGEQVVVVTNTTGARRTDLVSVQLDGMAAGEVAEVLDEAGLPMACLSGPGGREGLRALTFVAPEVPGVGYRSFRARRRQGPPEGSEWSGAAGGVIANEHLEVEASPGRGGGLVRVTELSSGFELVPRGEVANELVLYPEYANHPRFGEGPWNLLPSGRPSRSRHVTASVRRQISALGQRLVVEGVMAFSRAGVSAEGVPAAEGLETFRYRQISTLWKGLPHLDLRTEIHDWSSQDWLVRLRFPTTLTGATPVSAVGDAVVARGFGLIDVDAAEAPWTLDNPAAEWFGLSTTLVVEAAEAGRTYHRRAVGVAEVVAPPGQDGQPWARRLVVALVQKGVTATCSEAGHNRYGALVGDSNLPDFRIAVGGPSENPFVAELLDNAPPVYRQVLTDQLARTGTARLLVPAEHPLREVWQPNADLRGPRALPVLVVAGSGGDSAAAAEQLAAEVAGGRIVVDQAAHLVPEPEQVPDWTAALVNRGTPGFAVDSSGAMHVSLLRACTGWPSGVWIDPPRRHAPDGSAFETEHWSHVFDHALLLARGDWREAGIVEAAQAWNRPLVATVTDRHPGPLPATAELLGLRAVGDGAHPGPHASPPGRPVIGALKPAGNRLAAGNPRSVPEGGPTGAELCLRVYESSGRPVEVELTSPLGLRSGKRANLLEEVTGDLAGAGSPGPVGALGMPLAAGEVATALLRFAGAEGQPAGATPLPGEREVAEPVFSRYWLHNRGAAPIGNQSLAVHVLSTAMFVREGGSAQFVAQVASGSASGTQAGRIEIVAPPDWAVSPASRLFSLAAGAFVQVSARFEVPAHTRPGRYFISARVVDEAGQVQEDVLTVDVLPSLVEAPPPAPFSHPSGQFAAEVEAWLESSALTVAPGGEASLGLVLVNRTAGEIRAEVQLVSPVETWPWTGPWSQALSIGPGAQGRAAVTVRAPAEAPLSSWALFKVTYFGRLWYSPAVALELGPAGAGPA